MPATSLTTQQEQTRKHQGARYRVATLNAMGAKATDTRPRGLVTFGSVPEFNQRSSSSYSVSAEDPVGRKPRGDGYDSNDRG